MALVALSAMDPARLGAVADAVSAIRGATDRVPKVMVGGRLAERPGVRPAVEVDWVGTSIVEAAAFASTIHRDAGPTG